MSKKTEIPFRNSAGEIYVPPPAGHFDTTPEPTEKEAAEYSAGFDEALKRFSLLQECEKLENDIQMGKGDTLKNYNRIRQINLELKKLPRLKRPSQRHKVIARQQAEKIWREHPEWTIKKVSEELRLPTKRNGGVYFERTIRNWIKDLAPHREPGRRKAQR